MDWIALWQFAAAILVDYFAVLVGALTGALFALERKLDIVGTVTLGLIVGYGGGIIRDTLLHDKGFFFMEHSDCVVMCIVACLAVAAIGKRISRLERTLFYMDALSMALFAVAGTSKAWAAGAGVTMSIVLGVMTAVGGGIVRDVCVGETPKVFKPSTYYALSAVAGCCTYVAIALLGLRLAVACIACVVVTFGLTVLSKKFGWRSKEISGE